MAEYFPTSFTTVQPGPGTIVLGDDGTGPVNVDTSQIASYSYVYSTVSSASATMLESPEFMGTPTAPTAPQGTDTNQLATTAFVQTAVTAASGTYAELNGSAQESFQVAAASGGTYAPQTLQVQNNSFNYSSEVTSASGASGMMYTATYDPPITAYVPGQVLWFEASATNLGPVMFNAGPGYMTINGLDGLALQGYEIIANSMNEIVVNPTATAFRLVSPGGSLQIAPANYSLQAVNLGQFKPATIYTATTTTGTVAQNSTTNVSPVTVTMPSFSKTGAFRVFATAVVTLWWDGGTVTPNPIEYSLYDGTTTAQAGGANAAYAYWPSLFSVLTTKTYTPLEEVTFYVSLYAGGAEVTTPWQISYFTIWVVEA